MKYFYTALATLFLIACTSTIIMVRKSDNTTIDANSNDTINLDYRGKELKVEVHNAKKDTINK